jgi:hypothetical protein
MIHNCCGNHLVVQQHHGDAKTQSVWTQECQFKQGSPDIAITTTLEIGQEVGVASFGTKGKNCDKTIIRNGVTCSDGIDDLRGKLFFGGARLKVWSIISFLQIRDLLGLIPLSSSEMPGTDRRRK